MSDKFAVETHKQRLITLLEELKEEDETAQSARKPVTLDQQAVGRLSRMDAIQNQSMAQANHRRRETAKLRISAALARVENGEFGFCQDCGEAIEDSRLDFDPTILKCKDCAIG